MRHLLKLLLSLIAAFLLMLAFRGLVITVYSVDGNGLEPEFIEGDRVMVNRWSYGLRTRETGLFSYGRLCRQPIRRGDIVAYENPHDSLHGQVLFGRIGALPGDTVRYQGQTLLMPCRSDCADADYYWIKALNNQNPADTRSLGYIGEQHIIGRAFTVAYSLDPEKPIWKAFRSDRWFLKK